VADDAQFGISRVFKPQAGFEAFYQGVQAVTDPAGGLAAVPVPFFEWENGLPPNPRDESAGREGFNENLLRFAKIPFGCKVKIKIPMIFFGAVPIFYSYIVVFRDRSLAQYAGTSDGASPGQGPYHNPNQRFGAPDTSGTFNDGPRIALPAVTRTVIYNRPRSLDPFLAATGDAYRQYMLVRGVETPFFPLIGAGELGVYQQGIVDPLQDPATGFLPTFVEDAFDSFGDEMLILAVRECLRDLEDDCIVPTWDFAQGGFDQGFSNIYGTNPFGGAAVGPEPSSTPHVNYPDAGIYVYTGAAP
jgi:hypothetical protein